jgi:short-subunit dehydrogenase
MIKINLKAPIRIMKAVLYEMDPQGSGSIINIGSSWSSRLGLQPVGRRRRLLLS